VLDDFVCAFDSHWAVQTTSTGAVTVRCHEGPSAWDATSSAHSTVFDGAWLALPCRSGRSRRAEKMALRQSHLTDETSPARQRSAVVNLEGIQTNLAAQDFAQAL
jgi:hypothetical protein